METTDSSNVTSSIILPPALGGPLQSYSLPEQPVIPTIISLSELLNTVEVLRSRENEDRTRVDDFTRLGDDVIRETLTTWALAGFPNSYVFHTLQFNILSKCSDGVTRDNVFDYIQYLVPEFSLQATLNCLEEKLPGMHLSYSYTKNLTLYIHVSKKE